MTADLRQFAPATGRNRDYILPILQRLLPDPATVLEIGSGSGEHAVFFAGRMPHLEWLPTDMNEAALASISGWITHTGVVNVRPPVFLDVRGNTWPPGPVDALVAINVIHFSPWESTPALLGGAARVLAPGGVAYCYGPYRRGGGHTAPSNEAFDAWLKERDPTFGVRDLEAVEAEARACGLHLAEVIEMPANNLSLVFRRP